jgi:DNA-binding transcriptional LysR family regulator
VTRAAERLGMQQPPLSQQIKAIERELGLQLFHRKARGVDLTAPGRALLADARAILLHVDRAFETAKRTARGEQGRISVGTTPTSPFHPFLPCSIREFRETYPLVSVSLKEWASNELVDYLRNERVDVAFIRTRPAEAPGLPEEELIAVLPEAHSLARDDVGGDAAIPLRALASETFLIQGGQAGLAMYADTVSACRAAGFTPRIGHESRRLASTLSLVAIGLGVSIVPASLRRIQMDGLAYRRIKSPLPLKAPLILASRRGEPSVVVQHFVRLIKMSAKNFSESESHREMSKAQRNRKKR